MTYLLRLRPEVVEDIKIAADWYDDRKLGLSGEFLQECEAALDRILKRPARASVAPDGVRSVRILRFPYVIYYRIEFTIIVVFSIMFGGREDSSWRGRI